MTAAGLIGTCTCTCACAADGSAAKAASEISNVQLARHPGSPGGLRRGIGPEPVWRKLGRIVDSREATPASPLRAASAFGRAVHARPGPQRRDGRRRAGVPVRRRRAALDRRRLSPLHEHAARGRPAAARDAYAAVHGPQPSPGRRRAGRRSRGRSRRSRRPRFAGHWLRSGLLQRPGRIRSRRRSPPRPARSPGAALASTSFWVDCASRVAAPFFTQMPPSSAYPLRRQLRQLVYQAMVD